MNSFITIVQEDLNITKASEKLFVSQSAISKMIASFENRYDIRLFERDKGRLVGLTTAGVILYHRSIKIIELYNQTLTDITSSNKGCKTIRIGVPTFIFSDFCTKYIINLSLHTDEKVKIELIESNTADIREKFINKKIDIAIILSPTGFSTDKVDERLLFVSELDIFFHKNHTLNLLRREIVWEDLNTCNMVMPTPKSMLHTFIMDRLNFESINCQNLYFIDSIDIIMQMLTNNNYITLMPKITKKREPNVVNKPINNPILWQVVLCRHKE